MAHPAQRMIDAARRAPAVGGVVTQAEANRYGLIDRPGRPGALSERAEWDAYQVQRAKDRDADDCGTRR